MKKRSIILPAALATLIGFGGTACMGSFALTKMLYNFNNTVTDSKLINNLIFWALCILPVYGLAVTGDAVILNLIEFWTGSNLLAAQPGEDGTRLAQVKVSQDANGVVTVSRGQQVFTLTPLDEQRVLVATADKVLGFAELRDDGSMAVYGEDGAELGVISAGDFANAKPQLDQLVHAR